MENLITEGKKLVTELNKAADAYYNGTEYITDKEYDAKFDQLKAIENELGKPFPDSPTLRAGYAVKSALDKITHEYSTLSLDKTKDADVLVNWLADQIRKACYPGRWTGSHSFLLTIMGFSQLGQREVMELSEKMYLITFLM